MSEPRWSKDDARRKRGGGGLFNWVYPLVVAAVCLVAANHFLKLNLQQSFGDELWSLKDNVMSHLRGMLP